MSINNYCIFLLLFFKPNGVKTNLGIGKLSDYETKKLDEVGVNS